MHVPTESLSHRGSIYECEHLILLTHGITVMPHLSPFLCPLFTLCMCSWTSQGSISRETQAQVHDLPCKGLVSGTQSELSMKVESMGIQPNNAP